MVTVGLGTCIGIVAGFLAGRAYQIAVRAWKDYRVTKAQVPVLLRAAIIATRGAAGAIVVVGVVAGIALYAASNP